MGKRFRTDYLDQALLLPPSLHDWLPEGHLARFIADVVEELDLKAVYQSYEGDGRGLAAYQPSMMIRLLVYGYCLGVVSSRKIERATQEDVAFRFLSADTHPDHARDRDVPQAPLESAGGAVCASVAVVREGGLGEVGARSHRRHQDQSERQQAQGDEL